MRDPVDDSDKRVRRKRGAGAVMVRPWGHARFGVLWIIVAMHIGFRPAEFVAQNCPAGQGEASPIVADPQEGLLGKVREAAAAGDSREVLRLLPILVRDGLEKEETTALVEAGRTLQREYHDCKSALGVYQACLGSRGLTKETAYAAILAASCYENRGSKLEARDLLVRTLEVIDDNHPKWTLARNRLAELYRALDEPEKAVQCLEPLIGKSQLDFAESTIASIRGSVPNGLFDKPRNALRWNVMRLDAGSTVGVIVSRRSGELARMYSYTIASLLGTWVLWRIRTRKKVSDVRSEGDFGLWHAFAIVSVGLSLSILATYMVVRHVLGRHDMFLEDDTYIKLQAVGLITPVCLLMTYGIFRAPRGLWRWGHGGMRNGAAATAAFAGGFLVLAYAATARKGPPVLEVDDIEIAYAGWSGGLQLLPLAIAEEYLYRGVLFSAARSKVGFVLAVILSSTLFAMGHSGGEAAWLLHFLVGVLACILFERFGTLLWPSLFHVIVNLTIANVRALWMF